MFDVRAVELRRLVDEHARRVAHLPEAGATRPQARAERDDVGGVAREQARHLGSRTHEAHRADRHEQQLRKLVEVGAAQEPAVARDLRGVELVLGRSARHGGPQRAQLGQPELAAALADPALDVEGAGTQRDRAPDGEHRDQWECEQREDRPEDDVDRALECQPARLSPPVDASGRRLPPGFPPVIGGMMNFDQSTVERVGRNGASGA